MIENENNLDNAQAFPLKEKNGPENFYMGANRGEVLLEMTKALEQGEPLLILTGEEGSGKTVICRLLEREAAKFCFTVFLTKSVESFEDVVKKMAMWLGLATEGGYEGKNVDRILDNITAHLKRESTGLLIIFDEAENIYLATLERIRKMLDRITQAGAHLHIVFSGRKPFLENYAQLAICDFKVSDQVQFELAPLSEQETGEYLHSYSMDTEDSDRKKVFNDEIIRNIYSLAQGNFRRTNELAEESLRTHGDDTSFMVLLENVKEEVGVKQRRRKRRGGPNFLKRSAHYLPWVGGLGCALLLLFFLMRPGGGDQHEEKVEISKKTADKVEVVESQKLAGDKKAEEKASETPPVAPTDQPAAQAETRESLSDKNVAAENSPAEAASNSPAETVKGGETVEEKSESKQENEIVVRETPASKVVQLPVSGRISPPATAKVMQLRQEKPMKIKKVLASDKGGKGTNNVPAPPAKEIIGAKNQLSVEQVLQKRMAAGAAWSKKAKEDKYTMQLMALTDKNAEDNLRKMLSQPKYRQESDNFYIFKKSAASTIVFVFYGEYPSLALAREAQDNLPPFLVIHQPYPISIKGAMDKVKK